MISVLAASSGSSHTQAVEAIDNALWLVKEALLPTSRVCLELGILFCNEFVGKLSSGIGSDGSSWGFRLFGRSRRCEEVSCRPIELNNIEYDVRQYVAKMNYFDFILHHKTSKTNTFNFRIDICLPDVWCQKLVHSINETDQLRKEKGVTEFLSALKDEIRLFLPKTLAVANANATLH